jgi:hypothetical protein
MKQLTIIGLLVSFVVLGCDPNKRALQKEFDNWLDTQSEEQIQFTLERIKSLNSSQSKDIGKEVDGLESNIPTINFEVVTPFRILTNRITKTNFDTVVNRYRNLPVNQRSKIPTNYVNTQIWKIMSSIKRLQLYQNGGVYPYEDEMLFGVKSHNILYDAINARNALNDVLDSLKDDCYLAMLNDPALYNGDRDKMANELLFNRVSLAYQIVYNEQLIPDNLSDANGIIPVYFNLGRLCPPKCPDSGGAGQIGSTYTECK